ncbi:hypothetical protein, partial [Burkholderia sp. LMG 13014]|uniref:hypothetical protein n=1 Tax=Burkholderia sp. LMG 13014 TaxID=2709306 RepID=UPI0019641C22
MRGSTIRQRIGKSDVRRVTEPYIFFTANYATDRRQARREYLPGRSLEIAHAVDRLFESIDGHHVQPFDRLLRR